MAMVLSCVALVATVWWSASANIASTGVVLISPVIALPTHLCHIPASPSLKSIPMATMPLLRTRVSVSRLTLHYVCGP